MIKLSSEADKVCVAKANEAGQGHLFDGWDDQSPEEQRSLIHQVESIDFQLTKRLVERHVRSTPIEEEKGVRKSAALARLPSPITDREEYELCLTLGEYALRNQEIVVVTAAGGGGTVPHGDPVGLLPVGPVTGKSLFQLHAEKLLALGRRYRISLRWEIFCHRDEVEVVAGFFRANSHFGLRGSDVTFTAQDLLPVVDRRGRILLEAPGRIAMAPGGNGQIFSRILEEPRLASLENAGVRHLVYFQVDNAMVKIADPVFLGYHIKNQCEVASKAVRKLDPEERVGVFCARNGGCSAAVVEACELGNEERAARLPDGNLLLHAANTGVHIVSIEFLRRLADEGFQMPYHAVEKPTPCLSRQGKVVRPVEPNSLRFVAFAADILQAASRQAVVEVSREDEFSPVKNPGGDRSPLSAQRDLSRSYARWLREAGVLPAGTAEGAVEPVVEIAPTYALDAGELKAKSDLPLVVRGNQILLGGKS